MGLMSVLFFLLCDMNHIYFSFLPSMEYSQLLMRLCHIAATTHPKDTGGTSRTRRREVRFWQFIKILQFRHLDDTPVHSGVVPVTQSQMLKTANG